MRMRAVQTFTEDFTVHATQALLGQERIVLISMNVIKILATQMQPAQTQFLHTSVLARQDFQAMVKTVRISTNA